MFNDPNVDWSSLVQLGLEEELLNLYSLEEQKKHEERRDRKLIQLLIHKKSSQKSI